MPSGDGILCGVNEKKKIEFGHRLQTGREQRRIIQP
jgi:hypothetical protein